MKKKPLAAICLACLALAAASTGTLWAVKYPPRLHWREIERSGFTIIFPAARSAEAMYALVAAESFNERLAPFWGFRLPGRVRIVLSDATDQPNGFATFFPFNLVGADLAEPPPDSELATSFGSLDLVLAHELTHLFTMHAGSPPFRAARHLFGSLPLLYPAMQMPAWVVEGLAVEGESRFTGDGRLDHPPYRLMLSAARRDSLFPGWSTISGIPAAWPGPAAKYLFGAGFMEFLAEKYGSDSLRKYLERITGQMILFGNNRDFMKVFGLPLQKLWNEYRAGSGVSGEKSAPEPLTSDGFLHLYPCPLPDGRLAYYRRDYRGRGTIEVLEPGERRGKVLFGMDAVNGLSFAASENKIYLSATDHYHAFSDFSDLYDYDMKKGRLRRLSRGQRLFQTVKKENSAVLYCVQRRDGRFYLARFDTEKGRAQIISSPFAGMAQPTISPDNTMIAAAVKPAHEPWGIAIFTLSGQLQAFRTFSGSNLSQPRWQDNQTVLFILSGEETTTLASFSIDSGDRSGFYRDPRLDGLQQFALSADGREIFFTYFSGRGQEIAKLALADLPFTPVAMTSTAEIPEPEHPVPSSPGRPYRFWRDLLPRWWAPAWRLAGDEFQAGIITSGQDALGIHSFSVEGYYGFSSRRLNILFQYVYDGLFPTLSLAYGDNTDRYREEEYSWRTQELKLASLWPLRIRRRWQLYGYTDLHLRRRSYWNESGSNESIDNFNGIRLGLEFNSAREYYDSVSPVDGVRLAMQFSIQPTIMGNEFASRSAQLDLRHYIPLFRPGVLAWRLALAQSWDDPYGFTLGGLAGKSGSILGKNNPFDLLRGFPAGYDRGKGGYLFNLEYRLPLFKIEKAILPALSFDRVYVNAFFDMGHLWHGTYSDSTMYSIGTEMVLRLAFGGAAAYDFSLGAAYGFGPERPYQVYLRMGRSF